jgi:hypothetical protein
LRAIEPASIRLVPRMNEPISRDCELAGAQPLDRHQQHLLRQIVRRESSRSASVRICTGANRRQLRFLGLRLPAPRRDGPGDLAIAHRQSPVPRSPHERDATAAPAAVKSASCARCDRLSSWAVAGRDRFLVGGPFTQLTSHAASTVMNTSASSEHHAWCGVRPGCS